MPGYFVGAILGLVVGSANGLQAPDRASASRQASLVADLRVASREAGGSYQKLLFRCYHVADAVLRGASWDLLEAVLKAQGCKLEEGASGSAHVRRYEIAPSGLGYRPFRGPWHQLVIRFDVYPKVSRTAPTVFEVWGVECLLRAKIDQPLAEFNRRVLYPPGTVLSAIVRSPALRKAAAARPKLKAIDLEYNPPGMSLGTEYRDTVYEPYRFSAIVDLARVTPGGAEYSLARNMFEAPAFLERAVSLPSYKPRPGPFVPSDSIGTLVGSGEPFSWSEGGPPIYLSLSRKGWAPQTLKTPTGLRDAYSAADLRALPPDTLALRLLDHEFLPGDLRDLARFTRLRYLDMSELEVNPNNPLREGEFLVLGRLGQLHHLEIQGKAVTDRVGVEIAKLRKLEQITITDASISDRAVRALCGLPELRTLKLSQCERLRDLAMGRLTAASRLETLELSCDGLGDRSLKAIGSAKSLRSLDIVGGRYTDAGLAQLGKLANLRSFSMGHNKSVTSAGFGFLKRLPGLREVDLFNLPLGDPVAAELAGLKKLRRLSIGEWAHLSDSGVQQLTRQRDLDELLIQLCPRLTARGLKQVRRALPWMAPD